MERLAANILFAIVMLILSLFTDIISIENNILKITIIFFLIITGIIILVTALPREIKHHKKIEKMLENEPDLKKRVNMKWELMSEGEYNPKYKTALKFLLFGSLFVIINLLILKSNNDFLLKIQELEYAIFVGCILAYIIINLSKKEPVPEKESNIENPEPISNNHTKKNKGLIKIFIFVVIFVVINYFIKNSQNTLLLNCQETTYKILIIVLIIWYIKHVIKNKV